MEAREPGLVVAERYRLQTRLGEGGMGDVWSAWHEVTDKLVALKFLLASRTESAEARKRFLREAKAAARVGHPNVVPVHDVLELDDGSLVMVMDMLEGETLRDRLEREGVLSLEQAAALMLPVLSAVGTAHQAGVVHRDLKPENIFVTLDDKPMVLDFGIAKVTEADKPDTGLTNTGALLGTPHYMSPEQVFGEKDVDARADVWSLGVILYECLAGRRPFEGTNAGQVMKAVLIGEYEPLASASGLPVDVVELTASMLQARRRERLPDLVEAYDRLRAYSEVVAPPFSSATGLIHSIPSPAPKSDPYGLTQLDTGDAWDELESRAREQRNLVTAAPVETDTAAIEAGSPPGRSLTLAVVVAVVLLGGLVVLASRLTGYSDAPPRGPSVATGPAAPTASSATSTASTSPEAVASATATASALATSDPSAAATSPIAVARPKPEAGPRPPVTGPTASPSASEGEALPHGVHGEVPF
jgi:eukaryotic-like serine/threonine-protein kinase